MQKQLKVSPPAYKHYPYPTEGKGIIALQAPSPLRHPVDVGGSPPATLDRPLNKCVEPDFPSEPERTPWMCPNSPGHFKLVSGKIIPAKCQSWSCSFCAPGKKNRWLDRIARGTQHGGYRWRMLTLTQATSDTMPIMHAWARWRRYMANDDWIHLKYVWVKEFTQAGKRHLHVLVNAYVPWSIIKKNWARATRGASYIIHIADKVSGEIRDKAAYMSKYISKNLEADYDWRKYERRFGFSRWDAWREPEKPATGAVFILDPCRTLDYSYRRSHTYRARLRHIAYVQWKNKKRIQSRFGGTMKTQEDLDSEKCELGENGCYVQEKPVISENDKELNRQHKRKIYNLPGYRGSFIGNSELKKARRNHRHSIEDGRRRNLDDDDRPNHIAGLGEY